MAELKIEELSKEQLENIYRTYMQKDFPADELKPLPMLLKAMDDGHYDALGLMEEGEIRGYALFHRLHKDYLFDYLAVVDGNRNSGTGSIFLKMIQEHYKDADSIFGEVEDPDFAKTEEERKLQERRIGFYQRNGYIDTGVKVQLYGVNYRLIELDMGKNHTPQHMKQLYKKMYQSVFSIWKYWKYIKIK